MSDLFLVLRGIFDEGVMHQECIGVTKSEEEAQEIIDDDRQCFDFGHTLIEIPAEALELLRADNPFVGFSDTTEKLREKVGAD